MNNQYPEGSPVWDYKPWTAEQTAAAGINFNQVGSIGNAVNPSNNSADTFNFGTKFPTTTPYDDTYDPARVFQQGAPTNMALNNRMSDIPGVGNTGQTYQMPTMAGAMDRPDPRSGFMGWLDGMKEKYPNATVGAREDLSGVMGVGATAKAGWDTMNFKDKGSMVLGAANSVYGAIQSRKASKLAKEQFNFTKDSFNKNFEASAKTTNSQLADRQAARHDRNPNKHKSVADYMKKYGV